MDLTISVPEGSTNHGNPNLLCTPPNWYDYIFFFFANYFAHAATVIATPGQGIPETIWILTNALILPTSGVVRAMAPILRHSGTVRNDPLRRAARARALCMVAKFSTSEDSCNDVEAQSSSTNVRSTEGTMARGITTATEESKVKTKGTSGIDLQSSKHEPHSSGDSRYTLFRSPNSKYPPSPWWECPDKFSGLLKHTQVNGKYQLPKGYSLVLVPANASLEFAVEQHVKEESGKNSRQRIQPELRPQHAELASTYNIPKLIISFIQAIWAATTLYRARGDQIKQYGYAAFGLTVAPYAFMSVVNIVANILNPEYPALFLIRTPVMEEAEADGGYFNGEIRVVLTGQPSEETKMDEPAKIRAATTMGLLLSLIPLGIVCGLSRFQPQNSTKIERGFTMSWLVVGIVYGVYASGLTGFMHETRLREVAPPKHWLMKMTISETDKLRLSKDTQKRLNRITALFAYALCLGTPAVGGMIIVGRMIGKFGVCTLLN